MWSAGPSATGMQWCMTRTQVWVGVCTGGDVATGMQWCMTRTQVWVGLCTGGEVATGMQWCTTRTQVGGCAGWGRSVEHDQNTGACVCVCVCVCWGGVVSDVLRCMTMTQMLGLRGLRGEGGVGRSLVFLGGRRAGGAQGRLRAQGLGVPQGSGVPHDWRAAAAAPPPHHLISHPPWIPECDSFRPGFRPPSPPVPPPHAPCW